jgi:hypothetical protein
MADDLLAATLAGWREIEQAATPGPWESDVIEELGDRPVVLLPVPGNDDAADLLFQADAPQATEADAAFIAAARTAMPLLLSALDEVLKLHARQDKPVRDYGAEGACPNHRVTALGRMNFKSLHDCPDCQYTEHYVCSHCNCPNDEWHCPTVRAITAELTKGEAGDASHR